MKQAVDSFYQTATEYCQYISQNKISLETVDHLMLLVMKLYIKALALPNIEPETEYLRRLSEQKRLLDLLPEEIPLLDCAYDHEAFDAFAPKMAEAPEGGERCLACFAMRLDRTARTAKEYGFEYFTTTLSVSPHKNADNVNRIGAEAGAKAGVKYLFADFKKKNGYLRSLELSRAYNLYRQDYCGCRYSMNNS